MSLEINNEVFALFTDENSGAITSDSLFRALTAAGVKIAQQDIDSLFPAGKNSISFDDFSRCVSASSKPPYSQSEIGNAFECFDVEGNGTVSNTELQQILVGYGTSSNFSTSEIRQIQTWGNNGENAIDYHKLAKQFCL